MQDDIYPMPSFPMLVVDDPEASTQWYQETLGFKLIFAIPGPGGRPLLTHLRWTRYADLLLVGANPQQPPVGVRGVGVSLNYAVFDITTVDELATRARGHGAQVFGPVDQPWNAREVTILDPDGYRLTFTQPISLDMTMDEIVAKAGQHVLGDRAQPE